MSSSNPFSLKTMKHRLMARGLALCLVFLVVAGTAASKLFGFRKVAPGWWLTVLATAGMVYLLLDKTTFLPFLGEAALPPSVLKLAAPTESTIDVTVRVPGRATHVIYWAASPSSSVIPTPSDAYKGFSNAGVVEVINGTAVLPLQCPSRYSVRYRELEKHVHYRAVFPEGILGAVKTQNVVC